MDFRMHEGGEIDVRACYTTISVASVLKILDAQLIQNVGSYILRCQTYEGGIAGEPDCETHGGKKYQIMGCSGQGGFAQVFKAYVNNNTDDVVALKIQKPAFPWEFYMYRQLDSRIPKKEVFV